MRRAARIDSNHSAVVSALRKCGCAVQSLAAVGAGVPDLLCCTQRGHTFLAEVKDGSLPPSARALTPDQREWHARWPGRVYVIERAEDVPSVVVNACRSAA